MSLFLHVCIFIFVFPVFVTFLFYRRKPLPICLSRVLVIGVPIGLLIVGFLWLSFGRYIPSQRVRLFETPISNIRYLQIKLDPNFSLVDRSLIVTNKMEIKDIMTALRSGIAYEPNHPGTRWACTLVVSDSLGNYYVGVENTPSGPYSQGTILYCTTSENGFIYSTLRSDTIGDILEKVAHNSGDDLSEAGWRHDKPPTLREMIFGLSLIFATSFYDLTIFLLVIFGAIYLLIRKKHYLSR
jgi:hypothetical protein